MCGPQRWLAPSTPATPTSSPRSWTVSWGGHDSRPRGALSGRRRLRWWSRTPATSTRVRWQRRPTTYCATYCATAPEQVADVLDALCVHGDVLPVVSTDLSHYLDLPTAQRRDRRTAQAVVDRDAAGIGPHDACGAFPLCGLLHWARRHELVVRLLHQGTSADAGGDARRVVGYAAFALLPSTGSQSSVTGG